MTATIATLATLAMAAVAMIPANSAQAQASVTISQPGGEVDILAGGGNSTFNVVVEDFEFGVGNTGGTGGFLAIPIDISGTGQRITSINTGAGGINDGRSNCDGAASSGCSRSFNTADFTISLPQVDGNPNPAFFASDDSSRFSERFVVVAPASAFADGGNETIMVTVTARNVTDVTRRNVAKVFTVMGEVRARREISGGRPAFSVPGTFALATENVTGFASFTITGPNVRLTGAGRDLRESEPGGFALTVSNYDTRTAHAESLLLGIPVDVTDSLPSRINSDNAKSVSYQDYDISIAAGTHSSIFFVNDRSNEDIIVMIPRARLTDGGESVNLTISPRIAPNQTSVTLRAGAATAYHRVTGTGTNVRTAATSAAQAGRDGVADSSGEITFMNTPDLLSAATMEPTGAAKIIEGTGSEQFTVAVRNVPAGGDTKFIRMAVGIGGTGFARGTSVNNLQFRGVVEDEVNNVKDLTGTCDRPKCGIKTTEYDLTHDAGLIGMSLNKMASSDRAAMVLFIPVTDTGGGFFDSTVTFTLAARGTGGNRATPGETVILRLLQVARRVANGDGTPGDNVPSASQIHSSSAPPLTYTVIAVPDASYTISGPGGGDGERVDLAASNPNGSFFDLEISNYIPVTGNTFVAPVIISGTPVIEAIDVLGARTLQTDNFTIELDSSNTGIYLLSKVRHGNGSFLVRIARGLLHDGGSPPKPVTRVVRLNIVAKDGATRDVATTFTAAPGIEYQRRVNANGETVGNAQEGLLPTTAPPGSVIFTPRAPVPRVRITQTDGVRDGFATISANAADSRDFVVSVENYEFPLQGGQRQLNAASGRFLAVTINTGETGAPFIGDPNTANLATCATGSVDVLTGCAKTIKSRDFTISLPSNSGDAFFTGGLPGTTSEFRLMVPRGNEDEDPNGTVNSRLNASYTLSVRAGSFAEPVPSNRRNTPRMFTPGKSSPFRGFVGGKPDSEINDGSGNALVGNALVGSARFAVGAELDGPELTLASAPGDLSYERGQGTITEVLPLVNAGSGDVTYTLGPDTAVAALRAAGLTYDGSRTIGGAPTALLPQTTFTYTAVDSASPPGSVVARFTITIVEPVPPPTLSALDVVIIARDSGNLGSGHEQILTRVPGPTEGFSSSVTSYTTELSPMDIMTVTDAGRDPAIAYRFVPSTAADTVLFCRDNVRVASAIANLPVTTATASGRDLPAVGVPTQFDVYVIRAANVVGGNTESNPSGNPPTVNPGSNNPGNSRHRTGDVNVACTDANTAASESYVNKYAIAATRGIPAPTATLTVPDDTANELNTGIGSFQINLTNVATGTDPVVIPYAFINNPATGTTDLTAEFGVDYEVSNLANATFSDTPVEASGTITVLRANIGEDITITITPIDDTMREAAGRELVTLEIGPAANITPDTPIVFDIVPADGIASLAIVDGGDGIGEFTDVCDRTAAVRDAIVAKVGGSETCDTIIASEIALLTGTLAVSGLNGNLALGDLDDLASITGMNLAGNSMTGIPGGVFRHLNGVTTLTLDNNVITNLGTDTFTGLNAVQTISFTSDVGVSQNPDVVFANGALDSVLGTLTTLTLSNGNGLKRFANFTGTLEAIPMGRSAEYTIQLTTTTDGTTTGTLPAAVMIPVTSDGSGMTIEGGGVVIRAGERSGVITITSGISTGSETLTIGTPQLGVFDSGEFTANTEAEVSDGLVEAGTESPTVVATGAAAVIDASLDSVRFTQEGGLTVEAVAQPSGTFNYIYYLPSPVVTEGSYRITTTDPNGSATFAGSGVAITNPVAVGGGVFTGDVANISSGNLIIAFITGGGTSGQDNIGFRYASYGYGTASTDPLVIGDATDVGSVTLQIRDFQFPTVSTGDGDFLIVDLGAGFRDSANAIVNNEFNTNNTLSAGDTNGVQSLNSNLGSITLADANDDGVYLLPDGNNNFRVAVPKSLLMTAAGTDTGIGNEDITLEVLAGGTNAVAGTYTLGYASSSATAQVVGGTNAANLVNPRGGTFETIGTSGFSNTQANNRNFAFETPAADESLVAGTVTNSGTVNENADQSEDGERVDIPFTLTLGSNPGGNIDIPYQVAAAADNNLHAVLGDDANPSTTGDYQFVGRDGATHVQADVDIDSGGVDPRTGIFRVASGVFSSGVANFTISVDPREDDLVEGAETVVITLFPPMEGGSVLEGVSVPTPITVTIADNSPTLRTIISPRISVEVGGEAMTSLRESASPLEVWVEAAAPLATEVIYTVALELPSRGNFATGDDVNITGGTTITLEAGETDSREGTSSTLAVTLPNTVDAGDETFRLSLLTPNYGSSPRDAAHYSSRVTFASPIFTILWNDDTSLSALSAGGTTGLVNGDNVDLAPGVDMVVISATPTNTVNGVITDIRGTKAIAGTALGDPYTGTAIGTQPATLSGLEVGPNPVEVVVRAENGDTRIHAFTVTAFADVTFASQIALVSGVSPFAESDGTALSATTNPGVAVVTHTFTNLPAGTATVTCVFNRGGSATNGTDYFAKDGTADVAASLSGRYTDRNCGPATGETTATTNLRIIDDDLVESDETFTLQLISVEAFDGTPASLGSATVTSSDPITLTITDDDEPTAVMSFSADTDPILENGGTSTLTLTLDQPVPENDSPLSFPYRITGIQPTDITGSLTGFITVAAGTASKTLLITAADDERNEGNETMTIELGSLPSTEDGNAIADVASDPRITITDDDGGTFMSQIARPASGELADGAVSEGDSDALSENGIEYLTQTFTDFPNDTVTFTCVFNLSGTADFGTDYIFRSGGADILPTALFSGGAISGNFTEENCGPEAGSSMVSSRIKVLTDTDDEDNETVILRLVSVTAFDGSSTPVNVGSATIGTPTPNPFTVTIEDDDEASQPTSVASFTASESNIPEDGTLSSIITLTLNTAIPGGGSSLAFPYRIEGIDVGDITLASLTGEITVEEGEISRTLTITAAHDTEDEGARETMTITLGTPPVNADGNQIMSSVRPLEITITDDDTLRPTSVTSFIEDIDPIAEDGGRSTVTLTLNAPVPAGGRLAFGYAITGIGVADITLNSLTGEIFVLEGTNSVGLEIVAVQDNEDEGDGETMTIELTSLPNNGGGVAVTSAVSNPQITITDDDATVISTDATLASLVLDHPDFRSQLTPGVISASGTTRTVTFNNVPTGFIAGSVTATVSDGNARITEITTTDADLGLTASTPTNSGADGIAAVATATLRDVSDGDTFRFTVTSQSGASILYIATINHPVTVGATVSTSTSPITVPRGGVASVPFPLLSVSNVEAATNTQSFDVIIDVSDIGLTDYDKLETIILPGSNQAVVEYGERSNREDPTFDRNDNPGTLTQGFTLTLTSPAALVSATAEGLFRVSGPATASHQQLRLRIAPSRLPNVTIMATISATGNAFMTRGSFTMQASAVDYFHPTVTLTGGSVPTFGPATTFNLTAPDTSANTTLSVLTLTNPSPTPDTLVPPFVAGSSVVDYTAAFTFTDRFTVTAHATNASARIISITSTGDDDTGTFTGSAQEASAEFAGYDAGVHTVTITVDPASGANVNHTIEVTIAEPIGTISDLCSRTPAMQTALLGVISDTTCGTVTTETLNAIPGTLDLQAATIRTLQEGDFADLEGVTQVLLTGPGSDPGVPDANNTIAYLTALGASTFAGLTNTNGVSLDLGNNRGLAAIHADTFAAGTGGASAGRGVPNLNNLDLLNAAFSSLPATVFDDLSNLATLGLRNALADNYELPSTLFDDLTRLTSLDLRDIGGLGLPVGVLDGPLAGDDIANPNGLQTLLLADTGYVPPTVGLSAITGDIILDDQGAGEAAITLQRSAALPVGVRVTLTASITSTGSGAVTLGGGGTTIDLTIPADANSIDTTVAVTNAEVRDTITYSFPDTSTAISLVSTSEPDQTNNAAGFATSIVARNQDALSATITAIPEPAGPTMIMSATDNTATEDLSASGSNGAFTIDISGVTPRAINIPYTLSGTATGATPPIPAEASEDLDFSITTSVVGEVDSDATARIVAILPDRPITATSGTIQVSSAAIADPDSGGSNGARVLFTIMPNDDHRVEENQTVILSLGTPTDAAVVANPNDFTYNQRATSTRTVTITDRPNLISAIVVGSPLEENAETIRVTFTGPTGAIDDDNPLVVLERDITLQLATSPFGPEVLRATSADYPASSTVILTAPTSGTSSNITFVQTSTGQAATLDVPFMVVDDDIVEGDETFGVQITNSDAAVAAHDIQTITINDNDEAAVTVHVSGTVNEGRDLVVTASLDKALAVDITLAFALTGTAQAGGLDYNAPDPSAAGTDIIKIDAGSLSSSTSTSPSLSIPILRDGAHTDTLPESLIVSVADAQYGDVPTTARATAIDADVDTTDTATTSIRQAPPDNHISLQATAGALIATEAGTVGTFTVGLSEVDIGALVDAAQIDLDYTLTGSATPPSDTSATTAVVIASGTEDYDFAVDSSSTATGVTIIGRTTTGGTIRVPITDNFDDGEEAHTIILSVTPVTTDRSIESDETVILGFANTDNTAGFTNTGTEGNRTYADRDAGERTVMITDDGAQLLTYGFAATSAARTEPGTGTLDVAVAVNVSPDGSVPVVLQREVTFAASTADGDDATPNNNAVVGEDYTRTTQTFTLLAGTTVSSEMPFSLNVPIRADTIIEPEQTLLVNLAPGTNETAIGGTSTRTEIRIQDNEPDAITIGITSALTEAAGAGNEDNITLTMTRAAGVTLQRDLVVAVDTSAATNAGGIIATTGGTDYTAISTERLTVSESDFSGTTYTSSDIDVAIVDDEIVEGPEVFSVDVTEPTADPAIRTFNSVDGVIVDDDTTRAVLTITSEASGGVIEGQIYAATVTLEDNKTLAERATFTIVLEDAGADVTLASPPTLILSVGNRTVTKAGAFIITSDSLSNENDTFGANTTVDFGSSSVRDYTNLVTHGGFSGVRINEVPTLRLSAGTDSAAREDGVGLVNGVGSDSSANTATFEIRLRDVDTAYTGDVVFPVTIDSSSTAVAADYEIGVTGVGTGGPSSTTFTIGTDVIFTIGNDVINGGIDGNADVILTVTPVNDNTIETTVETLVLSLGTPTTAPMVFDADTSTTATVNITDLPNQIWIMDIGDVQESLGAVPGTSTGSTAMIPVTFMSGRAGTSIDRDINLLLESGEPNSGIVALGTTAETVGEGFDYKQEDDRAFGYDNNDSFTGTTNMRMVPINVRNDTIVEGDETIAIAILEGIAVVVDGVTTVTLVPDPAVVNHTTRIINITDEDDTTTATVVFDGFARNTDGTATATVELVKPLAADATFTLELLGPAGVAANAPNEVMLSGDTTVTITAGQTTTTQNVDIDTDGATVGDTFTVGIVAPPAYTNSADRPPDARQAILRTRVTPTVSEVNTIVQGPEITLAVTTDTASDTPVGTPNALAAEFTITLANFTDAVRGGDGTEDATVGYAFTGDHTDPATDPATFGGVGVGDYTVTGAYTDVGGGTFPFTAAAASGTFTVDAGAFNSSGTATLILTVTPTPDNRVENPENVILTIGTPSPSHLAEIKDGDGVTDGSGTITINDGPPEIIATIASDATVTEPAAAGSSSLLHVPITLSTTVDVTLDRPIFLGFYAGISTDNDADADALDFDAIAMGNAISVTVPTQVLGMGDTNITLNNDVRILGDNVVEGPETFTFTLIHPDTAITIGGSGDFPVTITDEDVARATVIYSGVARVTGDTARATVVLDKPLATDVTFTLNLLAPNDGTAAAIPGDVDLLGDDTTNVAMRQVTIEDGDLDTADTVAVNVKAGATATEEFRVGIVAAGQTNEPAYTESGGAVSARQANLAAADIVTLVPTADKVIVTGPGIALAANDPVGRDTVTGTDNRDDIEYVITLDGYDDALFTSPTATSATVNYAFTGDADFGTDYTVAGVFSENGGATPTPPTFDYDGDGTGFFTFPFVMGTGTGGAFVGGSATLTLTVTPTPDTVIEEMEPVILGLTATAGSLGGTVTTGTISADINDAMNQITLVEVPASLDEGETVIPVTFTAASGTDLDREVELLLNSRDKGGLDEAVEDVDYVELTDVSVTLPDTTTFPIDSSGAMTTHIMNVPSDANIMINNDNIVEGDEVFEIRFSTEDPAIMHVGPMDVAITDNDEATVNIVLGDTNAPSDGTSVGPFTATVQLTGDDGTSTGIIEEKVLPMGVRATYTLVPAAGTTAPRVDIPADVSPASATAIIPSTGAGLSTPATTFTINDSGIRKNFNLGIDTTTAMPVYTSRTGLGSRITVGATIADIRIRNNASTLESLTLTSPDTPFDPPTFSSDVEAYTASVANDVGMITVTPTVTLDSGATYEVTALKQDSSPATFTGGVNALSVVTLDAGITTTITVTVTAEDTMASTAYTIALTRSADASLCDRTPGVRDAIITALIGTPDCSAVTNADLGGLTELTVNRLDTNPTDMDFDGLRGLLTLNLTNSRGLFTTLEGGVFGELDALTTLNLSDDSEIGTLTTIENGVFATPIAATLTDLNLAGNNLGTLRDGLFDELAILAELDLSNTMLTGVDGAVFGTAMDLPLLADIDLGGNPNLVIEADSLDTVLTKLTALTWPTPRVATFVDDVSAVRGGGTSIGVTLGGSLPMTVSIPVTAGTAMEVTAGAATIDAGQDSGTSAITTTLDPAAQSGTLVLGTTTLTDVHPDVLTAMITSSTTPATITILEGPTASLNEDDNSLMEGDVNGTGEAATISIELTSLENNDPVTLEYTITETGGAVLGTDYTIAINGTATSQPDGSFTVTGITGGADMGTGMAEIVIRAVPDNYAEVDKAIILTITDPNGTGDDNLTISPASGIRIALPDDDTTMVSLAPPIDAFETNPGANTGPMDGGFALTLTGAPEAAAMVTYAATCGAGDLGRDYNITVAGGDLTGAQFCDAAHTVFSIPVGNIQGDARGGVQGGAQGAAAVTITVSPIRTVGGPTATETITLNVTAVTFPDADHANLTGLTEGGMVRVVDGDAVSATLTATRPNPTSKASESDSIYYYVEAGATPAEMLMINVVGGGDTDVELTVNLELPDDVPAGFDLSEGFPLTNQMPNTSGDGRSNFPVSRPTSVTNYTFATMTNAFTVNIPSTSFEDDGSAMIVLNVEGGTNDTGIKFTLDQNITDGSANLSTGGSGVVNLHARSEGHLCLEPPSVRDGIVEADELVNCNANFTPEELTEPLEVDAPKNEDLMGDPFDRLTMLPMLDLSGGTITTLPDGVFDDLTAVTMLDLSNNQIGMVTDDDIFDNLISLTELRLAGNPALQLEPGALDMTLARPEFMTLTWPRPATMSLSYMASDDPEPTGQAAGFTLAAQGDGPQTTATDDRGEITVSLSQELPVAVRVEITAVCKDDVGVTMRTTDTTGANNMITVTFAAGNNDAIMVSVNNPTVEDFECSFDPVVVLVDNDNNSMELGHESDEFMPRDGNSFQPSGVLGALVNEVARARTRNITAEQITRETEAITTVLAREQVGMVTRLVRQRVQDLALARPSATTTAGNDDMEVSLAQSPDNMQDFVSGLALNTARDMDAGGSYSLWARGQWVNISGSPDIGVEGFDYDGNVVGAGVGVEFRDYNSMFGIALNATRAEVDVTSTSRGKTTHEEDMFFAAPYAAWKSKFSGLTLWGTVGVGTGTAEITEADGDTADPGVTVFFTRGGMDVASEISDRTDLVFGLSGLFIDKTVEKFSLGSDSIKEINVQAGQAQVDLTAFLNFPVGDTIFRPYFGLASVHEVGDIIADDRHAMEARTGFGWDNHPWYLDVDGFYEFLREDEEAWGIFGEIRYAETNSGFQFGMTGNHGTASSMSEAATSTNTVASEFDASLGNADSEEAEWSLGAESSYSFAAPVFDRSGTAAPFISGTHAESGQTLGTGVRVGLTENIDMTVESDRHMPDNDDPYSEHAVGLNARWAF